MNIYEIYDIINSYDNENYDQMVEQINSYPSGKCACFQDLKLVINDLGRHIYDFADIVIMYFNMLEYLE